MTTPILMLALLGTPWAIGRLRGRRDRGGPIGLAAVFAFTGVGHFVAGGPMVDMLPSWVPLKEETIWLSGAFEIGLALAFLFDRTRRAAGMVAIAFLLAVLPLNVISAIRGVGPGGHQWGPVYLWIRVPLQFALIAASHAWAVRTSRGS